MKYYKYFDISLLFGNFDFFVFFCDFENDMSQSIRKGTKSPFGKLYRTRYQSLL